MAWASSRTKASEVARGSCSAAARWCCFRPGVDLSRNNFLQKERMGQRPETRRAAVGGCGTCYPVFSVFGCQASPYRGADWRFITGVHEAERQGRTTLFSPESWVPSPGRRSGTWLLTCRRTTQCRGPVDGTEPVARLAGLGRGSSCKSIQVVMFHGRESWPTSDQSSRASRHRQRIAQYYGRRLGQGDKASKEKDIVRRIPFVGTWGMRRGTVVCH